MKILIANTFYNPEIIGGAEISVQKLAEYLVTEGCDVTVLCTSHKDSREMIHGVKVVRFKPMNFIRGVEYEKLGKINKCIFIGAKIYQYIANSYNPFNYKKLKNIIEEVNPDVLHTNGLYEITPVIWKAAYNDNIPIIHTARDYFLVCRHATMLKHGKKCEVENKFCEFRRRLNARWIQKYVNYLTFPSWTMFSLFEKTRCLKGVNNTEVICNGIDYDINAVRETCQRKIYNLDENRCIKFIYQGNLGEHKGVRWLIESFLSRKDNLSMLYIAGKGPLEDYVRNAAKNCKNIVYKGFLKEDALLNLLQECDVLVCPSLWDEPFGRVVLDAYKNGLPAIVSNLGALPELVDHMKTGYVVNTNNIGELSQVITMLAENKDIIKKWIHNIPPLMTEFSIEKQGHRFRNIYKKSIMKVIK